VKIVFSVAASLIPEGAQNPWMGNKKLPVTNEKKTLLKETFSENYTFKFLFNL